MSNNKQSMKLYTEEQLHNTVIAISNYLDDINLGRAQENIEKHLKALKPIQLPSDEEIEDKGKWVFNNAGHTIFTHYNTVPSWIEGAKWMRDKIQGGSK